MTVSPFGLTDTTSNEGSSDWLFAVAMTAVNEALRRVAA
jgi:hypothetical protein